MTARHFDRIILQLAIALALAFVINMYVGMR